MSLVNQSLVKQVSDAGSAGTKIGQSSTDKVGFYGTSPVARPTITAVGTATATTTLNETRITRLYAALETLGLIATA